jgi:hypothetical protein
MKQVDPMANRKGMTRRHFVVATAFSAFRLEAKKEGGVVIDKEIPAGNIAVEAVEGDTVTLRQERRDTTQWWFYWAFRVCGAEGRSLSFRFTDGEPVGTRGPALSSDRGLTWRWLGKDFTTRGFTYTFGVDEPEVWFAMGMVYTQRDWERFISRHAGSSFVERGTLAATRKGRPVEKLRLGCLGGAARHRVLLTARHHACEMMANYVLEGIVEGALADDAAGAWLRGNVEFLVIPLVDTDGVEDGDQGKYRAPRDHARDYAGASLYPEIAALRALVPAWAGNGKLDLSMDIHCPWIRGTHNEWVYQVGNADQGMWAEQRRFGQILEKTEPNTLAYRQTDDLPFGKAWNTGKNYTQGATLSMWVTREGIARAATSFEIPFATANGTVVDAANARRFGRNMAEAIQRFLAEEPE